MRRRKKQKYIFSEYLRFWLLKFRIFLKFYAQKPTSELKSDFEITDKKKQPKVNKYFNINQECILLSYQFSSVAQLCPTLCEPMNRSTPGLPVHHQLRSSLKPMSIKSVMPSSHLILSHPLLLLPPIPPTSGSFPTSQLFT